MNVIRSLESLLSGATGSPVALARTKREDIDFSSNVALQRHQDPETLLPVFRQALGDKAESVTTEKGFINIRLSDQFLFQAIKS